jgi:hypothetical protein
MAFLPHPSRRRPISGMSRRPSMGHVPDAVAWRERPLLIRMELFVNIRPLLCGKSGVGRRCPGLCPLLA